MGEIQLHLLNFPSCRAAVFPGSSDAVVYLPMAPEQAQALRALLRGPVPALVALHGLDWNAALSPWPAEKVFRGGEDFSGGAPAFLKEVEESIIPAAEQAPPRRRMIAGYSLGGLFALYAALNSDAFSLAASVSGSVWFDGFADYALSRSCRAQRVYMSLGDKEKNTRNVRMACIEERSRAVASHLGCTLQMNPGGHFADELPRMARAINTLMNENENDSPA